MLLLLVLSLTLRRVESTRSVVPPPSETDPRPLFQELLNQKEVLRYSEPSINIYQ